METAMGTAAEGRKVVGQPAHRRRPSRRGPLVGLIASVVVLVSVSAAVAVGGPEGNVGERPQFDSQSFQGSQSPTNPASPNPEVISDGLTLTVQPADPPAKQDLAEPVRLAIPSVGIDARVDPTGVNPDGVAVVPKDAYRVGWYKFGPSPGSLEGSAVIVGHVDSKTQGRGALYPLRGVRVGDLITVGLDQGNDVVYRVVARESISKKRLPVSELFSRDGSPRLTLITCGGAYVKALGYTDNVVVTAEPVKRGATK